MAFIDTQKQAFAETFKAKKEEYHVKSQPFKSKLLSFEGIGTGAITWLVVFVLTEVLISGGQYEQNLFLGIISLLAILLLGIYYNFDKKRGSWKLDLTMGIKTAIVYAILDVLVIGLLLNKTSFSYFGFWGTGGSYALLIATPVVMPILSSLIKKRKAKNQISS